MSRLESAPILMSLGFLPGVDFSCTQTSPTTVAIQWFSAQAQPSDATLNAIVWSPAIEATAQDQFRTLNQARAVRLAANTAPNSTTTLADVGLNFNVPANAHLVYRFVGAYTSALTTTGLSLAVNGPANPFLIRGVVNIAMTSATAAYGAFSAYNSVVTAPTSGAATIMPFWVEGNLSTGPTAGILALRFASEVAASAVTILSGSYGQLAAVV